MKNNRLFALFLDDIRMPKEAYLYRQRKNLIDESQIPQGSWDIVRSYDEFAAYIKANGVPLTISFDNDLSQSHFIAFCDATAHGVFDWRGSTPKMGLHCLELILNTCKKENIAAPKMYYHTANPFARVEMEAMAENIKKSLDVFSDGGILLPE